MPSKKISWSNPSVLSFAGDNDPVELMENKARDLTLKAMEKGWSGPPFDPIKLAEILNIKVTASGDVTDAKTVSKGRKLEIEYNPNRPRGRIRFSIAHEIAHSLFDDCHEQTRYRHTPDLSSDTWQLETLCNIGASELIMPIGSHPQFHSDHISINQILSLRKEYDVSTEALLIRLAKLTDLPLSVFCSSKVDQSLEKTRFRIDYAIQSKSWPHKNVTGLFLSSDLLSECTAIGYTVKGEQLFPGNNTFDIECVGLPPHPGDRFPRIAGIISTKEKKKPHYPQIEYHEGDATKPGGTGPKIIAHIVNDKTPNWGGGGFAVALKRKYPKAQSDFKEWAFQDKSNLTLGRSHFVELNNNLYAYSMIAQHGYGKSSKPLIRYKELETCLTNLRYRAEKIGASVHLPRIGTGNAGGKWPVIEELLNNILANHGINVNVYDYALT